MSRIWRSNSWLFTLRDYLFGHRVDTNKLKVRLENLLKLGDVLEVVLQRLWRVLSLLRFSCPDCTRCKFISAHKTNQTNDNRADGPAWIPQLWVVVTETGTDLLVGLKATIWSPHLYARRFERVVSWKAKFSMVDPALIGTIFKSEYAEMPIENVGLFGCRYEILEVLSLK